MQFWLVVIIVAVASKVAMFRKLTSVELCQLYDKYDTNNDGKITQSAPDEALDLMIDIKGVC